MERKLPERNEDLYPYSGQLEIEIYFKEYKDSCANDCRRYLHLSKNGRTPLKDQLVQKLGEKSETFTMIPRDYALLRHVPLGIDLERDAGSKRSGAGKTRGGLEIYDVGGFDEDVLQNLRIILEDKKKMALEKKEPWFSYFRIYLRDEL